MAEQTAEEKATAQKKAFKDLVKEAVGELAAEQKAASTDVQRTTGREVDTGDKPKSFFELFGF